VSNIAKGIEGSQLL